MQEHHRDSRVSFGPAGDLSPSRSISHYSADSLIAVELCNWIVVYLQSEVQMLELLGTGSIQRLAATVTSRCKLVPAFSTAKSGWRFECFENGLSILIGLDNLKWWVSTL